MVGTSSSHQEPIQYSGVLFSIENDVLEQKGMYNLMQVWISKGLKAENTYDSFLETVHPMVLFNDNCLASPAMYVAMRYFLLVRGVEVCKQRGCKIVTALSEFYPEGDEREIGRNMILPRSPAAVSSTSTAGSAYPAADARSSGTTIRQMDTAGHVDSKHKDDSSNYSDSVGHQWNFFVQEYKRNVSDSNISLIDGQSFFIMS